MFLQILLALYSKDILAGLDSFLWPLVSFEQFPFVPLAHGHGTRSSLGIIEQHTACGRA